MPDVELPFSRQEYAARLHRVRQSMQAAGLEVMITCDPSNMAWLTGYDGWSFYVHQAVVVTLDHPPLWWGRRMDGFGALRTVYMDAVDVISYCDDYVMVPERHAMEHLAGLLRDRGLDKKRIGLELENYYFSAAAYLCLQRELPNARLTDATALVNWQRAVKSAQELVYMGRAARIVERMHTLIAQTIEPGMRKNDLVADIFHAAIAGTDEFGGDYAAIVPLLPTGKDACAAHLTWNDKPFERETCTFFEIAGCYRRYHAPLCRTVYLGTPPRALVEAQSAVMDGVQAGIEAAQPGNVAGDVARAFHGVLAKAGIHREGRCGYPIGLSYPPDWGERTISFRESDTTELQPNMTFHLMPGLWTEDWGLEITESIVIAESGPARTLANYPRRLTVKP
ncbi:MAG: ectoine hydrolase DoeA [Gammaproteobacteria bacterium]|nr:ectoine hydrolase DoeA [Gammaproteobacteria bacterium]